MIILGDNLELMKDMEPDAVDLVFTSPPYEAARTYGIDFKLKGNDWVDWAFERFVECQRVCKGLVAWVVEGQTRKFQYSASPILLMARLHEAGLKLRKPPIFQRVGIPGSGGPDWLRNDYEFIVCTTKGKLPWSDNTAMGHAPKWAPGGEMSYRNSGGVRRNQWGHSTNSRNRNANGDRDNTPRPSHYFTHNDGAHDRDICAIANPGNVIHCKVGGGVMGSKLCHENEAPFPESLAEFFIRSFCPAGGTVLDCHCGSGTTLAVANRTGRKFIGMDIRKSQIELTQRRLSESDARQKELM